MQPALRFDTNRGRKPPFRFVVNIILLIAMLVTLIDIDPVSAAEEISKMEPVDGQTNLPTTTRLEFSHYGGFFEYCIDVYNNNSCDTTWKPAVGIMYVYDLDPGETYYWQIRNTDHTSYADNGVWWSFTITGSARNKPDLRVTQVSYTPPSLQTGSSHFRVKVANSGTAAAQSFKVSIFIDKKPVVNPANCWDWGWNYGAGFNPIAAGGNQVRDLWDQIEQGLSDGRHYIYVMANNNLGEGMGSCAVPESNLTNNLYGPFYFTVGAPPPMQHPPVIIVHGWQGSPIGTGSGYHCSNDGIGSNDIEPFERYDETHSNSTLASEDGRLALADWFEQAGYEVWIAHLESTRDSTPPLVTNAQCLSDQIDYVASENPDHPITIVAHSMGGLVSRAALHYIDPGTKVKALYTLGSPHAGFPLTYIQMQLGAWLNQPAVGNMTEYFMPYFNEAHWNKKNIEYTFIGGDADTGSLGQFVAKFVGPNDGFVGKYSAVGWVHPDQVFNPSGWPEWSPPGQYWTDEKHTGGNNNYYSASPANPNLHSDSYDCMIALMNLSSPDPQYCRTTDAFARSMSIRSISAQSISSPSTFTEQKSGYLEAGQSISIPLDIDTETSSLFYLTWSGDIPAFTLTRPDTQEINPEYATLHPSEVAYESFAGGAETLPNQTYDFTATQSGLWQLNITAASTDIEYRAFAILDSSRSLTSQTDADLYQAGDTATLTATLENEGVGLPGATVSADLTFQDSSSDTVSLTDPENNGSYTATYLIPDIPGLVSINVTAIGDDNGTAFTRRESLLFSIASNDVHLTGNYAANPNDDNEDLLYEFLDFDVEVDADTGGEYAFSAELFANAQRIVQAADVHHLNDGRQTVTLRFNGNAIREAGWNGPYTISNLSVTPIDIGVVAQSAVNVLTTPAYAATQFGVAADSNSPSVSYITRLNANPISLSGVSFEVNFSTPVTGVDAADFDLTTTGVSGVSIAGVSGSEDVYTVAINTGTGTGTIRLDLADDDSIRDAAHTPLGGAGVGNGDFRAGEVYTMAVNVLKPTLLSPQRNYVTKFAAPEFRWNNVANSGEYLIEFAANSSFTENVTSYSVSEPMYTPADPFSAGTYYWHVQAYDARNSPSGWSTARVFTIDMAGPVAPTLRSPADNVTLRSVPIFRWSTVSDAVLYQFQLDNDSDFSSPLVSVQQRVTYRKPAGGLRGTYSWRVRARDAAGNWGGWSGAFTVTILRSR